MHRLSQEGLQDWGPLPQDHFSGQRLICLLSGEYRVMKKIQAKVDHDQSYVAGLTQTVREGYISSVPQATQGRQQGDRQEPSHT